MKDNTKRSVTPDKDIAVFWAYVARKDENDLPNDWRWRLEMYYLASRVLGHDMASRMARWRTVPAEPQ